MFRCLTEMLYFVLLPPFLFLFFLFFSCFLLFLFAAGVLHEHHQRAADLTHLGGGQRALRVRQGDGTRLARARLLRGEKLR